MSQKIDPKEVLIYLNELGYTNINAQQLKEFIIDLKKLIKYEYRYRKENIEKRNLLQSSSVYNSNYECANNEELYRPNDQIHLIKTKENRNVCDSLYKKPTMSSKAKEVPKRETQISVHITKAGDRNLIHQHRGEHCGHLDMKANVEHLEREYNVVDLEKEATVDNWCQCSDLCQCSNRQVDIINARAKGGTQGGATESTIKSSDFASSRSLTGKYGDSILGRSGKLRGMKDTKSIQSRTFVTFGNLIPRPKSDPVALYHKYQAQWKKQKIPGQSSHSDLRWAVREKMLKVPRIDYSSGSSTRTKSLKT